MVSLVWEWLTLEKGGGIYSHAGMGVVISSFKLANIDGSLNDAQLIAAICDAVIG